jgi:DNA-binding response OmpR family regulator
MSLVIIADDDEMVVRIVRAALENRGYIVGALSDGAPVREVVELKCPDVVILDCSMARVSGITALREIRASDTVYATPVLILTAKCGRGDEEIARTAGADDYLRKPFDPDELVARVDALGAKYAVRRLVDVPAPSQAQRPDAEREDPGPNEDAAIFDAAVLASVQRVISPERLQVYLREIDQEHLELVKSAVTDPSLRSQAHKIVSKAGMLGLTRMSECARALENACRSGVEAGAALLECRTAAGDVQRFAMPAVEASAV